MNGHVLTGKIITPADPFAAFWEAYPRKEGYGEARTAFTKATGKVDNPRVLIDAAARYAAAVNGSNPMYVKTPANWLRDERWHDEPVATRKLSQTELALQVSAELEAEAAATRATRTPGLPAVQVPRQPAQRHVRPVRGMARLGTRLRPEAALGPGRRTAFRLRHPPPGPAVPAR